MNHALFHNHIALNLDTFFHNLEVFPYPHSSMCVFFTASLDILSIKIRYMSVDMAPELKITFQMEMKSKLKSKFECVNGQHYEIEIDSGGV